jgi:hypothetical protein
LTALVALLPANGVPSLRAWFLTELVGLLNAAEQRETDAPESTICRNLAHSSSVHALVRGFRISSPPVRQQQRDGAMRVDCLKFIDGAVEWDDPVNQFEFPIVIPCRSCTT